MSQPTTPPNAKKNPFDPLGLFSWMRPIQDAWLDGMTKLLNQAVQSPEVSRATGSYSDAYLKMMEPFQQYISASVARTMQHLQLPTRSEINNLANRITQLEKRIDDLVALLEEKR
jgi:polyhydroxyalkanoate synthesis regulator phasin